MKLELCSFSQYKIYPSKGKRYVRIDGKVFNFINGKCAQSLFMKRNPRNTRWTVLYRRKHKKGTMEEVSKKRTRGKAMKLNRGIQGASLQSILDKRNQKPEVRKAQREQLIRAAKEKAAAKKKDKVNQARKLAQKQQMKQQVKATKVTAKGGASRGGKRF